MKKNLLFTLIFCATSWMVNSQTRITNNPVLVINAGNSVTCSGGGIITVDNSFYCVYDLDDYPNIMDTAWIVKMLVGAEETSGGPYNIVGKVHKLTSTPSILNLVFIADDTVAIYPDSTLYRIPIPFGDGYVIAGDTIVGELRLPANTTATFYPASNTSPQSDPTYIVAPGCAINDFTTTAAIGYPTMHIIMNLYVNQRPILNGFTTSTLKDQQLVFTQADFTAQYTDNDNDDLIMTQVVTVPTHGDLDLSGTTLVVGDTILKSELGTLKYFPNTGYSGPDNFSLRGRDSLMWSNGAATYDIDVINWQLGLTETENSPITVYPNPSSAQVTIQVAETILQIRIFNEEGKTVFTRVSDETIIDISKLETGSYFIQVKTEKGTYVHQLIKE